MQGVGRHGAEASLLALMHEFVRIAGDPIANHFRARIAYLDLLMSLRTTAEEWFRIELLGVLRLLAGIRVTGTNQQTQGGKDRPDFTLDLAGREVLVELKVLPRDRNYPRGWQRFQAGSNNSKDFENLVAGTRHGVTYIYWDDIADVSVILRPY